MPIHPLPVLSEEAEAKAIDRLEPPKSVVVRYGRMKQIGEFRYSGDEVLGCGTKLVCYTPRGTELADMLTTTCGNGGCGHSVTRKQMLDYIDQSGGKQFPFTTNGKVVRVATPEDLREQEHMDKDVPKYVKECKAVVQQLKLRMKVVDAEMLLGGERIVFYFTSEDRVDFRDLVKQLAGDFHTRIEMRQVGSRDEARLVADYEKCGQQCCCKQFLKVLKPVSMRNAKIQKATLDPSKISGRCGRLMCCLRYEEETYDDLRKRLPRRKQRVLTEDGLGTVLNTQILTQLALVELDDTGQRNAYPVENLEKVDKAREEEITAQRAELREQAQQQARAEARERRKERAERSKSDEPSTTDTGDQPKKKRRRRRRRRNSGEGGDQAQGQSQDQSQDEAQAPSSEPRRPQPGRPLADGDVENREGGDGTQTSASGDGDGAPKKKRRRRRRRRRKPGDGEGGQDPTGGGNDSGGD